MIRFGVFHGTAAGHASDTDGGDATDRSSDSGSIRVSALRTRPCRMDHARVRVPDPVRMARRAPCLRDEDRRELAGCAVPRDDGEARPGGVCCERVSLDADVRMEGPFRRQGAAVPCRDQCHFCGRKSLRRGIESAVPRRRAVLFRPRDPGLCFRGGAAWGASALSAARRAALFRHRAELHVPSFRTASAYSPDCWRRGRSGSAWRWSVCFRSASHGAIRTRTSL